MLIDLTTIGTISVLTVITLGLYPVFMTNQFQGAQAAFMGIGAYTTALMVNNAHVPAFVGLITGVIVAAAVGGLVGLLVRRLRAFYLAIATLAFGQICVLVAVNVPALGGALGLYLSPVLSPLQVFAIMLAVLFVMALFGRSKHALLYRVTADEELSAAFGVDGARARAQAFALGCGIAGLGGGLYILYLGVIGSAEMAFFPSLLFVIYIAFGGLDTVFGALLGVAVLQILQDLLRTTDEVRYIIYGLVIILLMIFRPRGLLNRRPLGSPSLAQVVIRRFSKRDDPESIPPLREHARTESDGRDER
jgi:branched-chain amino acid transport system permease protein